MNGHAELYARLDRDLGDLLLIFATTGHPPVDLKAAAHTRGVVTRLRETSRP